MGRKKPVLKKKSEVNSESREIRLRNQLARALADYDNFRKRVERENEQTRKLAGLQIAIRMLTVYDMLEEAQGHLKDSGIALTIKGFEEVLSEEGVEKMKVSLGTKFDAGLHEVVEVDTKSSGAKEGGITKILLSGWKYKDGPVVRPAKVIVFKKTG